jgi:hypothetical protein
LGLRRRILSDAIGWAFTLPGQTLLGRVDVRPSHVANVGLAPLSAKSVADLLAFMRRCDARWLRYTPRDCVGAARLMELRPRRRHHTRR